MYALQSGSFSYHVAHNYSERYLMTLKKKLKNFKIKYIHSSHPFPISELPFEKSEKSTHPC